MLTMVVDFICLSDRWSAHVAMLGRCAVSVPQDRSVCETLSCNSVHCPQGYAGMRDRLIARCFTAEHDAYIREVFLHDSSCVTDAAVYFTVSACEATHTDPKQGALSNDTWYAILQFSGYGRSSKHCGTAALYLRTGD